MEGRELECYERLTWSTYLFLVISTTIAHEMGVEELTYQPPLNRTAP